DPATDSVLCLADGTTICFCDEEAGEWSSVQCGEVCDYYGMAGDQCILGEEGPTCDCAYDCDDAAAVAQQCEGGSYTPCTCAASDPCAWAGDDYCDAACAEAFPDDHFDDPVDCACEGACTIEEFMPYCVSGSACGCTEGGTQEFQDCTALCAAMGATPAAGGACQEGYCACENYSCADSGQVAAQCDYGTYTPCTCGVANPCSWIGDAYCDTPSCNNLYPDQTNFDDTASDCGN
ncbi:MAG TPA: hypothetical protein PK313_07895, partial [Myxococcota bacterium]|nr:hypothetical protein [Myxococcota bacterium]